MNAGPRDPEAPQSWSDTPLLELIRALPRRPAEGWVTLLLVALMIMTVAWSIDDARWVLGQQALTGFLPWTVVLGVLWGFVSA